MTLLLSTLLFGTILALFIIWFCSVKLGFLSQDPDHYAHQGTEFDIRERLCGDMICEGVIHGPFGRVNTRFVAHMHAKWKGNIGHFQTQLTGQVGCAGRGGHTLNAQPFGFHPLSQTPHHPSRR